MAAHDGLVASVDCSTTACKAIAWNAEGDAVAEGRATLALANPAPDAWEQDAEEWLSSTRAALAAMSAALGPDAARVRALCIANQRETFVVTDEHGAPLAPAMTWMDGRATREVDDAVRALGRAHLHTLTGKPPCVTPSFYKLLHLLRVLRPELAAGRARVLDVHAFLAWRLTGTFATSLAAADPTGLVDMQARAWSDELLAYAGLDPSRVPALVEPGAILGTLTDEAARSTGLPLGLPLIAGAGDGQAAGLGAGIEGAGRAYLNLGTALVCGVLSRTYRTDDAFRTLYGAMPGTYFLETDLKGGTFTVSWLVERLLPHASRARDAIAELDLAARALPPGADGLLLVPYWSGVMNPYWDDDASGAIVGLRGHHGPAHVYRAILEGLAMEQRLHLEGVERATSPIEELVVMGGGSTSDLFCQIVADVTRKRVTRAGSAEATALGAGILAAAAAGLHADVASATRAMTRAGRSFAPGDAASRYDALFAAYRGLYPALRGAMQALAPSRA